MLEYFNFEVHGKQLDQLFRTTWLDPAYKYYYHGGFEDVPSHVSNPYANPYHNNFFSDILLSVDKEDNIIGEISYDKNKTGEIATGLAIIKFVNDPTANMIFGSDVLRTFRDFFESRGGGSIEFRGIPDNPAFAHYERIVERLGGRKVGVIERAAKLSDGKFYDEVLFQITKENYFAFKKKCSESKKHTDTGSTNKTATGVKSNTDTSLFESKMSQPSTNYPIGRGVGLHFFN